MKRTIFKNATILLFTGLFISMIQVVDAQSGASAVLDSALLEAQLDYIHENTRIYDNYRAIRNDIFLKLRRNVKDTLNATKLEVEELNSRLTERNFLIESLNTDLTRTKTEKDEAIRNRDSLSFIGFQMNKTLYSSIIWFIILGLAALAILMVMLFRRSNLVTKEVKKELQVSQEEFDLYRKSSREKYEKLVVSHHSEIMRLKNS
ncbi:MAG: hypothetical protein KAI08_11955 [Bacteroidales bacterium]|nr:hypothetical protein [Bacteroidales bacterium]